MSPSGPKTGPKPGPRSSQGKGRGKGRGRGKAQPHLVAGERAVTELMRASPERVRKLLVAKGAEFDEVMGLAAQFGVPTEQRQPRDLEDLVGPGLSRRLVAVASSPLLPDLEALLERAASGPTTVPAGRRVIVALDEVVDPHNLGAILRSAEFFGASGAFWARDRSAPLSAVAVRTSAGASERLPLTAVTNLSRALEHCSSAGFWIVGTVVEDGRPLREAVADLPDRVVLVMGSEGRGLRRLVRDRCDFLVRIDGAGEVGSLNVSAAAAVTLASLA